MTVWGGRTGVTLLDPARAEDRAEVGGGVYVFAQHAQMSSSDLFRGSIHPLALEFEARWLLGTSPRMTAGMLGFTHNSH